MWSRTDGNRGLGTVRGRIGAAHRDQSSVWQQCGWRLVCGVDGKLYSESGRAVARGSRRPQYRHEIWLVGLAHGDRDLGSPEWLVEQLNPFAEIRASISVVGVGDLQLHVRAASVPGFVNHLAVVLIDKNVGRHDEQVTVCRMEGLHMMCLHAHGNEIAENVTDPHLAVKYVVERDRTTAGRLHAVLIGRRAQLRCGTGSTRGATRREMRPEIGAGTGVK